jgi:hypothetical protein
MVSSLTEVYGVENDDEAFDLMEVELFEIKQFFLSKPLLWLTATAKLKRLKEISACLENDNSTGVFFPAPEKQQVAPLAWWKAYIQFKTSLKNRIAQAHSPFALIQLIEAGLRIEALYLELVPTVNVIEAQPVFGKEPDPMVLQNGFSLIAQLQLVSWEEIIKNKDKFTFDFLVALKRLSLLRQYVQA